MADDGKRARDKAQNVVERDATDAARNKRVGHDMTGKILSARLRFLWVLFRPEPVEFWTGLGIIGWGLCMFGTDDIRIGFKGAVMAAVGIGLGLSQMAALLRSPYTMTTWRWQNDAAMAAFLACYGIGVVRQYGIYPTEAVYFAWAGMNLSSAVRLRFVVR